MYGAFGAYRIHFICLGSPSKMVLGICCQCSWKSRVLKFSWSLSLKCQRCKVRAPCLLDASEESDKKSGHDDMIKWNFFEALHNSDWIYIYIYIYYPYIYTYIANPMTLHVPIIFPCTAGFLLPPGRLPGGSLKTVKGSPVLEKRCQTNGQGVKGIKPDTANV